MADRRLALARIRDCAAAMLANAMYVERELPNVTLPPELRKRTEGVASALVGTKHDVFSEIAEYDDLVEAGAAEAELDRRLERMVRWIGEDVEELAALVRALEEAHRNDPEVGASYVLVTESAANVLQAFGRVREAARPQQEGS